jgi:hypothetical protein
VVRLEADQPFSDALREETIARNRRLPDFKRVGGYLLWDRDFPRTTYLKIRRDELAEQIGKGAKREALVEI